MQFIKTMVIGGVVFLLPIVVLVILVGRALELTGIIAAPIAARLSITGLAAMVVADVLAVLLLLLVCFLAGLLARTRRAREAVGRLESRFLSKLPPYALLKAKTEGMLNQEDVAGLAPVVVRFDDSWQIAFEIERIDPDRVALFLPGAPDPWAGTVCVVTADRVSPLDVSIPFVARLEKRLGRGAREALQRRLDERPATLVDKE